MKQLQLIKTVCLYWHKETKSITLQVTVSESRVRAALNRGKTFQRVPKLRVMIQEKRLGHLDGLNNIKVICNV